MKKQVGLIGLGRMGGNLALNLLDKNWKVVVYNRHHEKMKTVVSQGAEGSNSLKEFVSKIEKPRVILLMITAGKPVEETINEIVMFLEKGDIIIDGGNSYYKDSIRIGKELRKKKIDFLDMGTSGGLEGARNGACLMIGGEEKTFRKIEPLFKDLATENGYGYMGKNGAGHFVKGIHNGVEYGMMGAIAEGLQTIDEQKEKFGTDLSEVIKVYNHGSIVESKLTNWLEKAWKEDNYLKSISGNVPKGETEGEMEKLQKIGKMQILKEAIKMRKNTRKKPSLTGKVIAAMRNQFGGHQVNKA